jgi:hypothetical protein
MQRCAVLAPLAPLFAFQFSRPEQFSRPATESLQDALADIDRPMTAIIHWYRALS